MGMFDRVMVRCPRCGEDVEFQSKAGECYMNRYTPTDAPPAVLADTIGDKQACRGCGAGSGIRSHGAENTHRPSSSSQYDE